MRPHYRLRMIFSENRCTLSRIMRRREAAERLCGDVSARQIAAGTPAGLGGALAVGAMEWLSLAFSYPLAMDPVCDIDRSCDRIA
jgi:hypothetical protein